MSDKRGLTAVAAVLIVLGAGFGIAGYLLHPAPGGAASSSLPTAGSSSASSPTASPTPSPVPTTPPAVVERGPGTFTEAGTSSQRVGSAGKLLRYRVVVEDGTGQDVQAFAASVEQTLGDPRGWTAKGQWSFQRVATGNSDFVVRLATPKTTDRICGQYGVATNSQVSCRGGPNVVINLRRWLLGIPAYDDVTVYRDLVVNHEVGHFLGHGHVRCPGKGKLAPVMQTHYFGMQGCQPNAWPYVDGTFITGPADGPG